MKLKAETDKNKRVFLCAQRKHPWALRSLPSPSGHSPKLWVEASVSPLCIGRVFTETLQEYLKVVMALKYEEKPPYALLRMNLEALLQDLRASAYDPLDLQMVP